MYFTYLIGWKELDKFYYGVRYKDGIGPESLCKTYFTSSKYVKDFIKINGIPDIVQIRKTFDNKVEAKEWETKVLRRLNCAESDKFLNKSNNNSFKNIVMDDDIRQKISEKTKGVHLGKKYYNNGNTNILISSDKDIPDGFVLGKFLSIESKNNMSIAQKNRFKNESIHIKTERLKKQRSKNKGKRKVESHGNNVSNALRGKTKDWMKGENNPSRQPEARKKISDKLKGRTFFTDGRKLVFRKAQPDGFYKTTMQAYNKSNIRKNTKYEILTPNGFQDFSGVQRKVSSENLKVYFNDKSYIICTYNHRFVEGHKEVFARNLLVGDTLSGKQIFKIERYKDEIDVYDALDVGTENIYLTEGIVSHNCEFLGSSSTLIRSQTIASLSPLKPSYSKDGLDVLEAPVEGNIYTLICDTSRGIGADFSAFTVVDSSKTPYKVVAKFRDNKISPLLYPSVIHRVANYYERAFVLVEINDIGQQVADILYNDLEYDNLLFVDSIQRKGQFITTYGGTTAKKGVRTTKSLKAIGCAVLKSLIEGEKLLIFDADIIAEISTFTESKGSYQADEGYFDDLIMTLVLFAWLSSDPAFKELTNTDNRVALYDHQIETMFDELAPVGLMPSNKDNFEVEVIDNDLWFTDKYGNDLNEFIDSMKEY